MTAGVVPVRITVVRNNQSVRRPSSWNRRGHTIALLVATIGFVAISWLADSSAATLRDRGIATQATVLSHVGGRSTWIEVRFKLLDGRSVDTVLNHSLGSYVAGETIPVRYDPANPELAGDERALDDRAVALIPAGFAAVCAVGAVLTWLRVIDWEVIARRWRRWP